MQQAKNDDKLKAGSKLKQKSKLPAVSKPYSLAQDDDLNVVNEPQAVYAAGGYTGAVGKSYYETMAQNLTNTVHAFNNLLQGATKRQNPITTYEKMDMINNGISKKDLEYLKQKSGLDYDQLSDVLSVARATLINKKGNDVFNATLSEKIVSLADIYAYGFEVFEDEARFNQWVFRPNQALGGKTPYSLLANQYGREEIKNLIGRIDYGVYA